MEDIYRAEVELGWKWELQLEHLKVAKKKSSVLETAQMGCTIHEVTAGEAQDLPCSDSLSTFHTSILPTPDASSSICWSPISELPSLAELSCESSASVLCVFGNAGGTHCKPGSCHVH